MQEKARHSTGASKSLSEDEGQVLRSVVLNSGHADAEEELKRRSDFLSDFCLLASLNGSDGGKRGIKKLDVPNSIEGLTGLVERMGFKQLKEVFSLSKIDDETKILSKAKSILDSIPPNDLNAEWWTTKAQDSTSSFIAALRICAEIGNLPRDSKDGKIAQACWQILNGGVPPLFENAPLANQADLPLKVVAAVAARVHARGGDIYTGDPGQASERLIADRLMLPKGSPINEAQATIFALSQFHQPGDNAVVDVEGTLSPDEFVVIDTQRQKPMKFDLADSLRRLTHGLSLRRLADELNLQLFPQAAQEGYQAAVAEYIRRAEEFLKQEGYRNAVVNSLDPPKDKPHIKLHIHAALGNRFIIENVWQFKDEKTPPEVLALVNRNLKLSLGMPYSDEIVVKVAEFLERQLQMIGYPDVKVVGHREEVVAQDERKEGLKVFGFRTESENTVKDGEKNGLYLVTVRFEVFLGPRCRIMSAYVHGIPYISDRAYQAILGIEVGDWWPGPPSDAKKDAIRKLHTAFGFGMLKCKLHSALTIPDALNGSPTRDYILDFE